MSQNLAAFGFLERLGGGMQFGYARNSASSIADLAPPCIYTQLTLRCEKIVEYDHCLHIL